MEQLQILYEKRPMIDGYIDRKVNIPPSDCNLYGPPMSGKSWLAISYLRRLPRRKTLYIDCEDLRIDWAILSKELAGFVKAHGITTLVLDHYHPFLVPPKEVHSIFVTRAPLKSERLTPVYLGGLDFEEFLAFQKGQLQPEHAFSSYLRIGMLPQLATGGEPMVLRQHRVIQEIFCDPVDRAFWRHLSWYQGRPVTPHQLYIQLRKEIKVSKDRVYQTFKRWQEEGLIRLLPKLHQPKAASRLLFFDFALPASMHLEKSLLGQLFTLVGQRLLSYDLGVYYSDAIDFFLPQEGCILYLLPFADAQSAAQSLAKKMHSWEDLEIKKVMVLTIANSFGFMFDAIEVEAKPIYEWLIAEEIA